MFNTPLLGGCRSKGLDVWKLGFEKICKFEMEPDQLWDSGYYWRGAGGTEVKGQSEDYMSLNYNHMGALREPKTRKDILDQYHSNFGFALNFFIDRNDKGWCIGFSPLVKTDSEIHFSYLGKIYLVCVRISRGSDYVDFFQIFDFSKKDVSYRKIDVHILWGSSRLNEADRKKFEENFINCYVHTYSSNLKLFRYIDQNKVPMMVGVKELTEKQLKQLIPYKTKNETFGVVENGNKHLKSIFDNPRLVSWADLAKYSDN